MDIFLFLFLVTGCIALALILIVGYSLVVQVKKTRKEILNLLHVFKETNTNLIQQTSKLEILDKQLRIIGSKLVPEMYKQRTSRRPALTPHRKTEGETEETKRGVWSLVNN